MEIVEYGGVLAQIVEAVANAGSPPTIQRIEVTPEEMSEIWSSNAFKTSISNYYGDTSAMTLEGITADHFGNIISMYLGGILITVGPWMPTGPYADLAWGPLTTTSNARPSFVNDSNYLYAGNGNPSDGMVVGSNGDIELALAIRKVGDPTYYGAGENYTIELDDDESWSFVVSVGALNDAIYNPLDMYNIRLIVDTDPETTKNTQIVFTLGQGELIDRTPGMFDRDGTARTGFIWYRGLERAITDSAQSPTVRVVDDKPQAVGFATQMIQQMKFNFISRYVPSTVSKSANGSFLGTYTFTLEATPKFGDKMTDAVQVQAVANVTKKS
jgi:hypothetical protein